MSPRKSEVWVTPIGGTAGDSQSTAGEIFFPAVKMDFGLFLLSEQCRNVMKAEFGKDKENKRYIYIYFSRERIGLEVPKGNTVLHKQSAEFVRSFHTKR